MYTKVKHLSIKSIKVGLSNAFHNKNNRTGNRRAFSESFIPTEISLADFVEHITHGQAWTQGFFDGCARRKDAFISAQTLALDLDENVSVEDALAEPFIKEYALLVHPSPSSTDEHPKTRVIFVLSDPITDVLRWEALQRGLIAHFEHLKPDHACKDAARMFYGSDRKVANGNLSAVLPLHVAGALTAYEAYEDHIKHKIKTVPIHPQRYSKSKHRSLHDPGELPETLIEAVENALGVRSEPTNHEGFTHKPVACPVKSHEHDDRRPAAFWNAKIHALTCFKCGETYNTHQVADALGISVKYHYAKYSTTWDSVKAQPLQLPTPDDDLHADHITNLRYISQIDLSKIFERPTVLIKSPIGTGKTQLAARVIGNLTQRLGRKPRVLALTHRQTLAENLADRLSSSNEDDGNSLIFESYRGLESADLRRIDRLVICYDSLWKLASVGQKLPAYDLLIIDEIEQFHMHLGGDTMRGGAPERAYRVLCQLVRESRMFLGMDAHLTDITATWLKRLVDDENVMTIWNQHRIRRGTMQLHETKNTAIRQVMGLVAENCGPVVIATNTRRMAKNLAHVFRASLADDELLVIHGGNANSPEMQSVIRRINDHISSLKLLIYSPSLGTGVDITTPVRAVVGIFSKQPLAPADMMQMMGRCRNTQERHAWVEAHAAAESEDWLTIFQRYERNALITGLHCHFDENGILAVSDIQRDMLRLLAMLEAKRKQAMHDPLTTFAGLAQEDGFDLRFVEGDDDQIHATLKQAHKTIKAQEKEAVLHAEPVSFETLESIKGSGTFTPEILAGHERFKIEHCVGQEITPVLYDEFDTSEKREKLRRFAELTMDEQTLKQKDRQEASTGTLLSRRKHRTMRRRLMQDLLKSLWGADLPPSHPPTVENLARAACEHYLTGDEIEKRISAYLGEKGLLLHSYLGWRMDQSKNPVAVLRWLLSRIGVTLESKQIMVNGERFRIYRIDILSWRKMAAYAEKRSQYLQCYQQSSVPAQKRHENQRQNRGDYSKHGYRILSTAVVQ